MKYTVCKMNFLKMAENIFYSLKLLSESTHRTALLGIADSYKFKSCNIYTYIYIYRICWNMLSHHMFGYNFRYLTYFTLPVIWHISTVKSIPGSNTLPWVPCEVMSNTNVFIYHLAIIVAEYINEQSNETFVVRIGKWVYVCFPRDSWMVWMLSTHSLCSPFQTACEWYWA